MMEGEFRKYNTNSGFIECAQWRNTPHAFSHFTFEHSNHQLIVVDIQGVGDKYTDPQMHTAERGTITKFGEGNLVTARKNVINYARVLEELPSSFTLISVIQCGNTVYLSVLIFLAKPWD